MFKRLMKSLERRRGAGSAARLRAEFLALQQQAAPELFVEVGAYDGALSMEIRQLLPSARIVAFEANPGNFQHFSTKIDHAAQGVEYVHSAVADAEGYREFQLFGENAEGLSKKSSLQRRSMPAQDQKSVRVPCVTLDSFFADTLPARVSLWIDVEGASREVLLGARTVLSHTHSALIEVEEERFWENQWLAGNVTEFMEDQGFEAVGRDHEYPKQYNILYKRK